MEKLFSEDAMEDQAYSRPDSFGDVRIFSVYVPAGRYRSADRIESAGWHKVNRQYHIRRREGAGAPLILFTVAGCGGVNVNGRRFQVHADEVCFLPEGVPCEYWTDSDEWWEFYWLHFSGSHALDLFRDLLSLAGFSAHFSVSSVRPLLERCLNTCFSTLNGELVASVLLNQLLSELLLEFCAREKNADLVDRMLLYLSAESTQRLSMDEMEKRFHYSKEYMIRTFHEQTRTTPYQYWREIKFAQARQMLSLSERSLEQIAEVAGYASAESFSKQFKLRYGMTPNRYRRETGSSKKEEY